ncbi:MAG: cell envelope integrity protein TolA [Caldimonas sp.]
MSTSTLPRFRDATMPRSADGLGRGAVLAVLVHLLLIVAIAFSVNWRAHEPEGVTAELWSAVPQIAAPRAVSPPPTPAPAPAPEVKRPVPAPVPKAAPEPPPVADAQIAIEKAKRDAAKREAAEREEQRQLALKREQQKAEAQKLEAQRAEAKQQDLQRQKAQREKALVEAQEAEDRRKKEFAEKARKEEATLVAQREAYLKRMQGQANATGDADSTGTAARTSGPSSSYAGRIKARIKPNIVFTDSVSGNPLATVEVRCATDGTITSRKLVRSSGNDAWDDAVLRAIDKTETLPRDTDGRVPPIMQIEFKPRD